MIKITNSEATGTMMKIAHHEPSVTADKTASSKITTPTAAHFP
jgi:hypothetical protein